MKRRASRGRTASVENVQATLILHSRRLMPLDQMLKEDLETRILREQSNKMSFYDIVEPHPQKRGKSRFQSIHS